MFSGSIRVKMSGLIDILKEASDYVFSEFGLRLEKSRVKIYSKEDWDKFIDVNGFVADAEGVYMPQAYYAYARKDSPALTSNVFHELFGHGLFCEHSQLGRTLVDMISKGEDAGSFC